MTREKAEKLAKETAIALGRAYGTARGHGGTPEGEWMAYSAEYIAFALLSGEIHQAAVGAVYSPQGERLKSCADGAKGGP